MHGNGGGDEDERSELPEAGVARGTGGGYGGTEHRNHWLHHQQLHDSYSQEPAEQLAGAHTGVLGRFAMLQQHQAS